MKKIIYNSDLGLLLFRLFVGLSMAFAHGLGKMPPSDQMVETVTAIGFPLPIVFAWCAALSEFVGGLLIAVGLFTRPAALFLGFTMGVAGLVVHGSDQFKVKELAFVYFFASLLFVFHGAGKYSLDKLIRKKD